MQNKNQLAIIPPEIIQNKILEIGGIKVILDRDLAEFYGVLTKNLNKAVNRNLDRFPSDFMFQLTKQEFENLKFHFGTSSWGGTRKLPYAFTEYGILMLSSVLNSKRAIYINIQIIRVFTKIRQLIAKQGEVLRKVEEVSRKTQINSENIRKHNSRLSFLDIVVEGLIQDVNNLNKLLPSPNPATQEKIGFRNRNKKK